MIYFSQLLETKQIEKLLKRYPVGLEVISFSIWEVLDNLEHSISYYQKEFAAFKDNTSLTFHGPFLDLQPGSCDEKIRSLTKERFNASYQAAQAFGSKDMIFHIGYLPNVYIEKYWLDNVVVFWKEFLEDKSKECMFYIENVLDTDWELLKEIIDRVNRPNFKACLDIGHVNAYSYKTVEEWIKALGERIGYVHLHNNDGTRDSHQGLEHGTLPIQTILQQLKHYAPHAKWSLEIGDEKMLEESLKYVTENYSLR